MPQLDSLTYFSQFFYLLVSFIGVYILTLCFIIPGVATTQKLRQKLNTVALLGDKCNDPTKTMSKANLDKVVNIYERLVVSNFIHYVKPRKLWLISLRMTQLCHTIQQKKTLCVRTIYMPSQNVTNNVLVREFLKKHPNIKFDPLLAPLRVMSIGETYYYLFKD